MFSLKSRPLTNLVAMLGNGGKAEREGHSGTRNKDQPTNKLTDGGVLRAESCTNARHHPLQG
jgi:hypothetical protein